MIGALCPDDVPLLGLISVMATESAMVSTCVLVGFKPFPLAATDFYQAQETSDMHAAVGNMVISSHGKLAKTRAGHLDVDAV